MVSYLQAAFFIHIITLNKMENYFKGYKEYNESKRNKNKMLATTSCFSLQNKKKTLIEIDICMIISY